MGRDYIQDPPLVGRGKTELLLNVSTVGKQHCRGIPPPPRRLWHLDPHTCGTRPRHLVPPSPNVMSGSATVKGPSLCTEPSLADTIGIPFLVARVVFMTAAPNWVSHHRLCCVKTA